ncbi:uncharacterized protein LOC135494394 isoform X2 [Lineus longissimus]|uniref:uncharacterized protein LOC135494394 isoform X2 n=1 Tax=Lineus longissimus TaxID=88925 RepID=UPI00315CA96F
MYPTGRPSEVRPADPRELQRHSLMDPTVARRLLLHDANSAKEIDMTHARIRAFDETVKYIEQMKFVPSETVRKIEQTSLSRASTPGSDSDLYVQPLDLSFQAKKQARDADSPLDLSVKTTRRSADTTGPAEQHELGLVKRHDLLSPRPSGMCDTTNAPRNPKKEKLLQYERVSQQNQQKSPTPQLLTQQQRRQQLQMQHYVQQRQHQQQQQRDMQLASPTAREPPKTKESVAVDSTFQAMRQQKLHVMQAYQSAFLQGHLPFSAPPSPMATQPMTQGLPHPHVNRVPRPSPKGTYSGREGEIRGPSPTMSPNLRATSGKESPKSTPKAISRPGSEVSRAGTPQIPPRTSPQMHPQLSQHSPAQLEQMRLLHHAMSQRYLLGSDGKLHPGYPVPPQDFRVPNGAVRLPNGMIQHSQTPPPRKREPSSSKPAAATPLRIEIPDSSHSSPLSDKISPSPAMQPRPSPSYFHSKPRMALSTPRFPAPRGHNRPGESGSPPPLSMADVKTPVAIPPPLIRGTSPLPSPQMPVLSPHTKSPTLLGSPRNSPTIRNSGNAERPAKEVELDSKEAVSAIIQELMPAFSKKYRNKNKETNENATGGPVRESILNIPRPLRMENRPKAIPQPSYDLSAPRQEPKESSPYEGKSVNSILESAIKREIQLYDKVNATALKKREEDIRKEENMDFEMKSSCVNKETIKSVDTESEMKNTNVNSELATSVVSDQESVTCVSVENDANSEYLNWTDSKDSGDDKNEAPLQETEIQNDKLVRSQTPTKSEPKQSGDSKDYPVKIRPPCGRIVQKTSPAPKVKLSKEPKVSMADFSGMESSRQRQSLVSKAETKCDSSGLSETAPDTGRQPPQRKAEKAASPGPSGVPPSQRPPPMRNVWSTIRIENGEISPMPMPPPVVKPMKKGACSSPKRSSDSPKAGRSCESPKGRPIDSPKGRPSEASAGQSGDSTKPAEDAPRGRPEQVKKGTSPKRAAMKNMAPLMKKTVLMRNKMQQDNITARTKNKDESDSESKRLRGPSGPKRSLKRIKKPTAAELRRIQRRRSILDEIANSQGFVGEAKKRKQGADDLYADPALLDREERALRRAMIQFSEMDGDDLPYLEDHELEMLRDKITSEERQGKVGTRKRRGGDKLTDASDSKKRKVGKGEGKKRKKGAASEVLETRTRTQAAATKTGPPLAAYNRNAAYERELKREEIKAKVLKAKRTKDFYKEAEEQDVDQDTENPDTGNDAPEPDIERETEDDDTRKMFRNKSRSAALRLLWQRRRIEQAKQWSYNSVVKGVGGKRKRRSRTKRIKFCRGRKSRSARLAREEEAAFQFFEGDDTYDFHDDDACPEMPDTRQVPPEMKRMVVNKNSGETILHRAARLGYEDVVIYCLETGTAAVNARDNAGYTPLHECCVRGHLNIAKYLINYGANVNCSATDGTRPIHDAVDHDRLEVVRLLLSHGADPLLATYSGRTPMKAARYPKMRAFLKGFLADLNGPNEEEGETPTPWEFNGSSYYSDPTTNTGFAIFSDLPSDPEDGDHDLEFEFSSQPHIRTYRLELENENGPKNYVLMTDVLEQLKLSRQEFMERHPKICVGTKRIRSAIFRQQVELSCFDDITGASGSNSRRQAQFTELLRLDCGVRELLDIPVVLMDYVTETVQIPPRVSDQEEDVESVMSEDTVIYDADDLGNEADVDEEKPSAEPEATTSCDIDTLRRTDVETLSHDNVIPKEVERTASECLVIKQEKSPEAVETASPLSELQQRQWPETDYTQERVPLSSRYNRDQPPRQMPDYYRQLPRAIPEGYPLDRRVSSAAVTSMPAVVRGTLPHVQQLDSRGTLDLNSAMHRSITQAMTHHPAELAVSREQMVAASREQMSKSGVNYHNFPYMYKTPHHSHMRGNVPAVHQYPLPHPASQQYPVGHQHPHHPPTTRTDYYSRRYRHPMPQNCHNLFQMQQQRSHRDHSQHLGAAHSKEMEALAEAKRTTDSMESAYLLKVATTPEEYFMTYKQRLNSNNSPQYHHQRNPPSLVNGIGTPPHPHVPAHVQTRPDRLPPYS